MDAFSYLSVLLSIILGLAITQILQGYRGLLLSRARVRPYAPPLIWSALMLVIATQSWWADFTLASRLTWTFPQFGMVLLHTVLIYMMAALTLPDVPAGEPVDLREHYHREARPFFVLMIAMLASSVIKELLLEGRLPEFENLVFHILAALLAAVGAVVRRPRFHEVLAPLMVALIGVYIAVLFARLNAG